tara:strand:+ start:3624 stop:4760 length:1137 start_codon:yes stop_codon:yes gene_type:complete
MAKQNRTILKNYFQTGDKPSQSEYADLIDSQLNLEDTSAQIVKGPLSCSQQIITNNLNGKLNETTRIELGNTNMDFLVNDVDVFQIQTDSNGNNSKMKVDQPVTIDNNIVSESLRTTSDVVIGGNITSSGFIFTETNITASGTITGLSGSFSNLNVSAFGDIATGNITSSGNISASRKITGLTGSFGRLEGLSPITIGSPVAFSGPVTMSSQVSSSGTIFADNAQFGSSTVNINGPDGHITASGNISASGLISQNITASGHISASGGFEGNITASNITASSLPGGLLEARIGGFTNAEFGGAWSPTTWVNINARGQFEGHITASGVISASGYMFPHATVPGFVGDLDCNFIIMTAPNGNKFKFTINNSGHLSLTGSAI